MADQKPPLPILLPPSTSGWLPLGVGVFLCLLVGLLWWSLDQREEVNQRNRVSVEARDLAAHVDAELRNRIPALRRMAQRWANRKGGTPEQEFVSDASAYLSDMAGLQAIEWADRNSIVRWVVPLMGNEGTVGLNLTTEARRRRALERARAARQPAMTEPLDLVQGGKGFLVSVPIFRQDDFEGFILAVFRVQKWLDHVFSIKAHQELKAFRVAVLYNGVPIYAQNGWEELGKFGVEATADTTALDYPFSVNVRPCQAFFEWGRTLLPRMSAGVGLLLSALVALVVHLLQRASMETRKAQAVNRALEVEMLERQRAGEELRQALSRLDLATKAGGIGVWTWEIASGALSWNERMYALYGLSADAPLSYDAWRKAIHPDDLRETEALLQETIAGKAIFDAEFRVITATGVIRHLAAAARVERDSSGRPQRLIGVNLDLTDRKQAEEALKKTEEQVRLLLNSTGEAIYGLDLQGNCTFANPACARMLGYTDPKMLLGKNMHRLIHHSYPDGEPMDVAVCQIYRAFQEGKGSHVADEVLWRADGTSFPAEYWSYPQFIDGHIAGAVVTFLDITERRQAEQRRQESEQRFRSLVETTSDWVWEVDQNGCYSYASPKVEDFLGYRPDEVIGKTPFEFMPAEEAQRVSALFAEIMKSLTPFSDLENVNRHKDGRTVILETSGVPVFYHDGRFAGYRGIDRDITVRKQAELALATERQRLANILEGTNVGTWEWNVQTGETVFNERWAAIVGYTLDELAPLSIDTWTTLAHPDDLARSGELLQQHFRKEVPYYECEARMRHKNGDWVWVFDRGKVVRWAEDGKPLMMAGTHQDITKRKLTEEKIQHMATHDALTGLPSLRLAKDRLGVALGLAKRNQGQVAVMFLDLDGFKGVNDTLGHEAGDYVLRQVAQRMLACVRGTDTVARVGGDEFLLLATELHSSEDAARIAQKVLQALAPAILFKKQPAVVGASIGIALFPIHSDNMDTLVKLADQAMYQVKNSGKNNFAFATPK